MKKVLFLLAFGSAAAVSHADYKVDMRSIDANGVGKSIGTVTIAANPAGGVVLRPALKGLPGGDRGFHVHEKADCGAKVKDGKPVAGAPAPRGRDTTVTCPRSPSLRTDRRASR
jgi:superoxide dismutase, Cu-Zn family